MIVIKRIKNKITDRRRGEKVPKKVPADKPLFDSRPLAESQISKEEILDTIYRLYSKSVFGKPLGKLDKDKRRLISNSVIHDIITGKNCITWNNI